MKYRVIVDLRLSVPLYVEAEDALEAEDMATAILEEDGLPPGRWWEDVEADSLETSIMDVEVVEE